MVLSLASNTKLLSIHVSHFQYHSINYRIAKKAGGRLAHIKSRASADDQEVWNSSHRRLLEFRSQHHIRCLVYQESWSSPTDECRSSGHSATSDAWWLKQFPTHDCWSSGHSATSTPGLPRGLEQHTYTTVGDIVRVAPAQVSGQLRRGAKWHPHTAATRVSMVILPQQMLAYSP